MRGRAFLLLKANDSRPESSKQPEIRPAILLKILRIGSFRRRKPLAKTEGDLYFRRFPLDMTNSLQSGSFVIYIAVFAEKIGAVSCKGMQG